MFLVYKKVAIGGCNRHIFLYRFTFAVGLLQKPTLLEDLVPTASEKWLAAYNQYFEIVTTYTPSIQSTENILALEVLSKIVTDLADIRKSISPNLPLEELHKKLRTVQGTQSKQQEIIAACKKTAYRNSYPTSLTRSKTVFRGPRQTMYPNL
jgi:hypothetical protein